MFLRQLVSPSTRSPQQPIDFWGVAVMTVGNMDHPLRPIRRMTDQALAALLPRFAKMYSDSSAGRRFRPSSCCVRCCSSRSTRCGVSAS